MSFVLRAARPSDLEAVLHMAQSTGGGFTNLPPDESKLAAKLAVAGEAFGRGEDVIGNDMFFFILEDVGTGAAGGTCQIFSQIGLKWPFYSYKLSAFAKYSKELDKTFSAGMLTLSTEYNGCSEVGGLFLHPALRSAGVGRLLARARYLFIRNHRPRFADRTVAELRGVIDEAGGSPFWDALGGRFFGTPFRDADEHNARHGNQFIADLMPKHPIYTTLLPDNAVAVMGVPHPTGRAAQRLLEKEGFRFEQCVDIFDGGPTLAVATDDIATVRSARDEALVAIDDGVTSAPDHIVTHGLLADFRAAYGCVSVVDGGVTLDAASARLLGASVGDRVTIVER